MVIEVSSQLIAQLLSEAESSCPDECCGILLGERGALAAIQPAKNIHPAPATHFEIDPQALIDAHRAARSGGPPVLGYYHSHPTTPPQPSRTDQDSAAGDGSIWAIIGQGRVTFWRDTDRGFAPLSYRAEER